MAPLRAPVAAAEPLLRQRRRGAAFLGCSLALAKIAAATGGTLPLCKDCRSAADADGEEAVALMQMRLAGHGGRDDVDAADAKTVAHSLSLTSIGERSSLESLVRDPRTPPCCGSDADLEWLKQSHSRAATEHQHSGHSRACRTVFLTAIIGGRLDPQGKIHQPPTFEYFERYYRSILALPGGTAQAVILHNLLPDNLTSEYSTEDGAVSFVKVDISGIDPRIPPNDLRYQLFEEQVRQHPGWDIVFMTDAEDVVVVNNPCALVEEQPEKVFVGSESLLLSTTWIRYYFVQMGGKYLDWYDAHRHEGDLAYLNCGILGGKRGIVLDAVRKLNAALSDPDLAVRRQGMNVVQVFDMFAFNYVIYTGFKDGMVTGAPLHDTYKNYENRTDTFFWHK